LTYVVERMKATNGRHMTLIKVERSPLAEFGREYSVRIVRLLRGMSASNSPASLQLDLQAHLLCISNHNNLHKLPAGVDAAITGRSSATSIVRPASIMMSPSRSPRAVRRPLGTSD
jgi:hypothetical protein